MTRTLALRLLLLLWLLLFAGAFVALARTPARDIGFTAGLNRVSTFFGWQIAAATAGLAAWLVGNGFAPASTLRRLSRVPLLVGFAGAAGLAALVAFHSLNRTPPDPPASAPTTVAPQ